jgi:mannose-1-phosphate guanylyltransferase
VAVLEADVGWSDLGSFPSLVAAAPADPDGNVAVLSDGASLITEDSRNCIVYSEGARSVALFGARDMVVVAVDDAVLVCPRERAEELKTLVEKLRAAGRQDLL